MGMLLLGAGACCRAEDGVSARSWGANLTLTSDYILRGVSQSAGDPAVQADIHLYKPLTGTLAFIGGLWGSSVQPPRTDTTSVELDPYLGLLWTINDAWSAKFTFVHYAYPWTSHSSRREYDEIGMSMSWRDGLSFGVSIAPQVMAYDTDHWVSGRTIASYDAGYQRAITTHWSAMASVGYYDLSNVYRTGYAYWGTGVSYSYSAVRVDLGYFGTDSHGRELYARNGEADSRLATTFTWRF
jgi:uncharacterized protein (TIGR02001 family)